MSVCTGQNDFSLFSRTGLTQLKTPCPSCILVSIVESTFKGTGWPGEPAGPQGSWKNWLQRALACFTKSFGQSSRTSASLTAHSQTSAPPLPAQAREPPGQARLPRGLPRARLSLCSALIGENTGNSETETTGPTHTHEQ